MRQGTFTLFGAPSITSHTDSLDLSFSLFGNSSELTYVDFFYFMRNLLIKNTYITAFSCIRAYMYAITYTSRYVFKFVYMHLCMSI